MDSNVTVHASSKGFRRGLLIGLALPVGIGLVYFFVTGSVEVQVLALGYDIIVILFGVVLSMLAHGLVGRDSARGRPSWSALLTCLVSLGLLMAVTVSHVWLGEMITARAIAGAPADEEAMLMSYASYEIWAVAAMFIAGGTSVAAATVVDIIQRLNRAHYVSRIAAGLSIVVGLTTALAVYRSAEASRLDSFREEVRGVQ